MIELPKIHDPRGNLTFIEGGRHIPFEIKRVYYLLRAGGCVSRRSCARNLGGVLVAMSGSFAVTLDNGEAREVVHLNRSYVGLYIPPLIWREIDDFSSGAVCMALASAYYDEADYFREYEDFIAAVRGKL